MQRAEEEYVSEKKSASREYDEKKVELRENLISELEEKKRLVECERMTIELNGDSMEVNEYLTIKMHKFNLEASQVKAPTTRKLRRRPNDPIVNSSSGTSDKRRKIAPAQLSYLLDDSDINDDLKAITRPSGASASTGNGSAYGRASNGPGKKANYNSPARHSDQSPARYSNPTSLNCWKSQLHT